jgi:hypothetical protein
MDWVKQAGNF